MADEVNKLVSILVKVKGTEEVQQGIKETYGESARGNEKLRQDSKRSGDDVELFTRKWKHQLLAVGSALGVLWGLAKTSPLAASMISMVGTALGYLASVILMPLLPLVLWLTIKIIELADWFNKLPDAVKIAAAALLGLAAIWALLKGLGLIDLAKKLVFDPAKWLWGKVASFLALWNATMAAGGLAGGIAFGAAVAVGVLAGLLVVGALIKSGVIDWVSKIGREFEIQHPIIMDVLKTWTAEISMFGAAALRVGSALFAFAKGLVSGDWSDWVTETTNFAGKLKADFQAIDDQRTEAAKRLDARARGEVVPAYVRPENANPTPLNFNVGNWLGLGSSAGAGGGLGGGINADQMRSDARAAGVPEAAIDQVLENMGAKIDQHGQQWNSTLQTNLNATGTTLADKSGTWSTTVGTSADASTAALTTGLATMPGAAKTAGEETSEELKTQGFNWGKFLVEALGQAFYLAVKSMPLIGGLVQQPEWSGSYATGGRVARTGLALMHEGDWVRSSFGDTTRTGTGGGVQNSGGGSGFTLQGDLNIYSQATDAAGIKRDILRELGSMARRA